MGKGDGAMNITMDTGDLQELKNELGHLRQMNVQLREENAKLRMQLDAALAELKDRERFIQREQS